MKQNNINPNRIVGGILIITITYNNPLKQKHPKGINFSGTISFHKNHKLQKIWPSGYYITNDTIGIHKS